MKRGCGGMHLQVDLFSTRTPPFKCILSRFSWINSQNSTSQLNPATLISARERWMVCRTTWANTGQCRSIQVTKCVRTHHRLPTSEKTLYFYLNQGCYWPFQPFKRSKWDLLTFWKRLFEKVSKGFQRFSKGFLFMHNFQEETLSSVSWILY